MLTETLVLSFLVKFRMMVEAELDGAADDLLRRDEAVGFGHDFAVNRAWFMSRRGAMVFSGLRHGFDLFFIEPFPQILVLADDASRNEMVRVAAFAKPRVVVGSDGVDHVYLDLIMLGQGQTSRNDLFGVVTLVSSIKKIVAGQNAPLDVLD